MSKPSKLYQVGVLTRCSAVVDSGNAVYATFISLDNEELYVIIRGAKCEDLGARPAMPQHCGTGSVRTSLVVGKSYEMTLCHARIKQASEMPVNAASSGGRPSSNDWSLSVKSTFHCDIGDIQELGAGVGGDGNDAQQTQKAKPPRGGSGESKKAPASVIYGSEHSVAGVEFDVTGLVVEMVEHGWWLLEVLDAPKSAVETVMIGGRETSNAPGGGDMKQHQSSKDEVCVVQSSVGCGNSTSSRLDIHSLLKPEQVSLYTRLKGAVSAATAGKSYCFMSVIYYPAAWNVTATATATATTTAVSAQESTVGVNPSASVTRGSVVRCRSVLPVFLWGQLYGFAATCNSHIRIVQSPPGNLSPKSSSAEKCIKVPRQFESMCHLFVIWWAVCYKCLDSILEEPMQGNQSKAGAASASNPTNKGAVSRKNKVKNALALVVSRMLGRSVDTAAAASGRQPLGIDMLRISTEHSCMRSELREVYDSHFASLFSVRAGLDATFVSSLLPQLWKVGDVQQAGVRFVMEARRQKLVDSRRPDTDTTSTSSFSSATECPHWVDVLPLAALHGNYYYLHDNSADFEAPNDNYGRNQCLVGAICSVARLDNCFVVVLADNNKARMCQRGQTTPNNSSVNMQRAVVIVYFEKEMLSNPNHQEISTVLDEISNGADDLATCVMQFQNPLVVLEVFAPIADSAQSSKSISQPCVVKQHFTVTLPEVSIISTTKNGESHLDGHGSASQQRTDSISIFQLWSRWTTIFPIRSLLSTDGIARYCPRNSDSMPSSFFDIPFSIRDILMIPATSSQHSPSGAAPHDTASAALVLGTDRSRSSSTGLLIPCIEAVVTKFHLIPKGSMGKPFQFRIFFQSCGNCDSNDTGADLAAVLLPDEVSMFLDIPSGVFADHSQSSGQQNKNSSEHLPTSSTSAAAVLHRQLAAATSWLGLSIGMQVKLFHTLLVESKSKKFVYLVPAPTASNSSSSSASTGSRQFEIRILGFYCTKFALHELLRAARIHSLGDKCSSLAASFSDKIRNRAEVNIYNQNTKLVSEALGGGKCSSFGVEILHAPFCFMDSLVSTRAHNRCFWTIVGRITLVKSISVTLQCCQCRGWNVHLNSEANFGTASSSGNFAPSTSNGEGEKSKKARGVGSAAASETSGFSMYPEYYRYALAQLRDGRNSHIRYGLDGCTKPPKPATYSEIDQDASKQQNDFDPLSVDGTVNGDSNHEMEQTEKYWNMYKCSKCVHSTGSVRLHWEAIVVVDDGTAECHVIVDGVEAVHQIIGLKASGSGVNSASETLREVEREAWLHGSMHYDSSKLFQLMIAGKNEQLNGTNGDFVPQSGDGPENGSKQGKRTSESGDGTKENDSKRIRFATTDVPSDDIQATATGSSASSFGRHKKGGKDYCSDAAKSLHKHLQQVLHQQIPAEDASGAGSGYGAGDEDLQLHGRSGDISASPTFRFMVRLVNTETNSSSSANNKFDSSSSSTTAGGVISRSVKLQRVNTANSYVVEFMEYPTLSANQLLLQAAYVGTFQPYEHPQKLSFSTQQRLIEQERKNKCKSNSVKRVCDVQNRQESGSSIGKGQEITDLAWQMVNSLRFES